MCFALPPKKAWIKVLKWMQVTMVATVSTFSGIHENIYRIIRGRGEDELNSLYEECTCGYMDTVVTYI